MRIGNYRRRSIPQPDWSYVAVLTLAGLTCELCVFVCTCMYLASDGTRVVNDVLCIKEAQPRCNKQGRDHTLGILQTQTTNSRGNSLTRFTLNLTLAHRLVQTHFTRLGPSAHTRRPGPFKSRSLSLSLSLTCGYRHVLVVIMNKILYDMQYDQFHHWPYLPISLHHNSCLIL